MTAARYPQMKPLLTITAAIIALCVLGLWWPFLTGLALISLPFIVTTYLVKVWRAQSAERDARGVRITRRTY